MEVNPKRPPPNCLTVPKKPTDGGLLEMRERFKASGNWGCLKHEARKPMGELETEANASNSQQNSVSVSQGSDLGKVKAGEAELKSHANRQLNRSLLRKALGPEKFDRI